jgi:hypothetical protein
MVHLAGRIRIPLQPPSATENPILALGLCLPEGISKGEERAAEPSKTRLRRQSGPEGFGNLPSLDWALPQDEEREQLLGAFSG